MSASLGGREEFVRLLGAPCFPNIVRARDELSIMSDVTRDQFASLDSRRVSHSREAFPDNIDDAITV